MPSSRPERPGADLPADPVPIARSLVSLGLLDRDPARHEPPAVPLELGRLVLHQRLDVRLRNGVAEGEVGRCVHALSSSIACATGMTLALAHPIGTSSATLAPRWLTRPG